VGDTAQRLVTEPLTVVGDADGALAKALSSRGAEASSVGFHELTRLEPGWIVLLGKAAVDGGRLALETAPEGSRIIVVLPRGAAAERLAALTLGARVAEPHPDPTEQAAAIVEALEGDPPKALGWTDVGSLLDAARARLVRELGAEQRGLQLELGSAAAVAAALDRFAAEVAGLTAQTRGPDALGPSVAVAELSWDDDPQTLQQKSSEVARWRRLSARGVSAKMIRGLEKGSRDDSGKWARGGEPEGDDDARASEIVTRGDAGEALPNPGRLPSGVMPEPESEDMTLPGENPLPLVRRHDPDIDETAPRQAIDDDDDDGVDFALPRVLGGVVDAAGSFHEDETKPAAYAMPLPPVLDPEAESPDADEPEARPSAPPPESLPPPAAEAPPESLPPPAPPSPRGTPSERPPSGPQSYSALEVPQRKSKLPLIFGLGVIVLGGLVALVFAGAFAYGALGSDSDGAVAQLEPPPSSPAPSAPPAPERATVVEAPQARGADVARGASADEAAPAAPVADPDAAEAPEPDDEDSLRERSDVLVDRGHAAERDNDLDAAREAYLGALEIYELNPHAHAGLARVWLEAGDGDAALPYAERAVELRRRRGAYYSLLGDVQRARGANGAARGAYERALELDPRDARARRALGM